MASVRCQQAHACASLVGRVRLVARRPSIYRAKSRVQVTDGARAAETSASAMSSGMGPTAMCPAHALVDQARSSARGSATAWMAFGAIVIRTTMVMTARAPTSAAPAGPSPRAAGSPADLATSIRGRASVDLRGAARRASSRRHTGRARVTARTLRTARATPPAAATACARGSMRGSPVNDPLAFCPLARSLFVRL